MIHTLMKEDGFEGILFPGNGSKDKVIIVMSGSNGGMNMAKHEAEFYHKNGIPAMSLALFKTKQTSPDLVSVTIEYVENAIRYLKEKYSEMKIINIELNGVYMIKQAMHLLTGLMKCPVMPNGL
ncbi:hypothetical protein SAMN04487928_103195 [Butyrivibrio proteoclasticus]|uniref:Uncharacterized protein n=1 Tax=Butyrivibrio proteoclasticus TaxID=43305 RepID=A0A1I5R9P4_9FIRM|nr:hypothetical protein [Butyrivibrio proteoclasticus]SFP55120.1 hypothetical protein SAMN04487928_103195 [Butyrivibrio proteoclasticus]